MRSIGVRSGQNYAADGTRDEWRPFRRLTLKDSGERVFLDRWGVDLGLFGLYLHRVAEPDPGLDLHDHPWPFMSLILWGGYTEEHCLARDASRLSSEAEPPATHKRVAGLDRAGWWKYRCTCQGADPTRHSHYKRHPYSCARCECSAYAPLLGLGRPTRGSSTQFFRRGRLRRMRLDEAHRITHVEPHTWTLVLRGRRVRSWGFYLPDGWVDYKEYDYNERRPGSEDRHDGTISS